MLFKFALVLVLATLAFGQNQNSFIIDDFSFDSPPVLIQIPSGGGNFPIRASSQQQSSGILGGERDIELVVTNGSPNLVITAGVAGGQFSAATPNQAQGYSTIQYDGTDSNDGTIRANGLGSVNFRSDNTFAIHSVMKTDIATTVEFFAYSGNSNSYCRAVVNLPGDNTFRDYITEFSSFSNAGTGGCDWNNIGAFEVRVNQAENVDAIIDLISGWAPIPVSASATRTPSPIPSASRSNTPSPSDTCVCICPQFTCELFRFDDHDAAKVAEFVDLTAFFNFWNLI
jgi:hypothetical protein